MLGGRDHGALTKPEQLTTHGIWRKKSLPSAMYKIVSPPKLQWTGPDHGHTESPGKISESRDTTGRYECGKGFCRDNEV